MTHYARPQVVIAGAGLGGLALAGLLVQRGFRVTVYEQSRQLGEIGAGIQLSPNAMKVMRALGLEKALVECSFEPETFSGFDWRSARPLYRTPIRGHMQARFGAPYLNVHRADLHRLLLSKVPSEWVHLDRQLMLLEERDDRVHLQFAGGRTETADVVVGADGIRSAVRRSLFGESPARFTGSMCWRGMVPVQDLPAKLARPVAANWMGPDGHVVLFHVRGGDILNFVAIREVEGWTEESWSVPSSRDELLQAFKGWHRRLLSVFERSSDLYKWGLFDRDPLPRWSVGRVTLLGDAAHPMLPYLAQGAAQAIEDAYVLADLLHRLPYDPVYAFSLYEADRKPRTSQVQLGARARGKSMHLTSRWDRMRRDAGFLLQRFRDPSRSPLQGEWIYSHDVTLGSPLAHRIRSGSYGRRDSERGAAHV